MWEISSRKHIIKGVIVREYDMQPIICIAAFEIKEITKWKFLLFSAICLWKAYSQIFTDEKSLRWVDCTSIAADISKSVI